MDASKDLPRPKIRFRLPRRQAPPKRIGRIEQLPGSVTTPRSPPVATVHKRNRKTRSKSGSSAYGILPSLRPGSLWRGSAGYQPPSASTDVDVPMEEWEDVDRIDEISPHRTSGVRGRYAQASQRTHERWLLLLPELIGALKTWSQDPKSRPCSGATHQCASTCSGYRMQRVACVSLTGYEIKMLGSCPAHPLAVSLIKIGFWPSAPTRPPRAFSIDLLNHYLNLYDACATPNDAFCQALIRSHGERGFYYLQGDTGDDYPMDDPWRRGFSSAALWYDLGRLLWKKELRTLVDSIHVESGQDGEHAAEIVQAADGNDPALTTGRASRKICQRCPACFSLEQWGRSSDKGPDVIVALDGNRQLKRLRRAGSSTALYDPALFLDKSKIVEMRAYMVEAQKRAIDHGESRKGKVAFEVLDRCRKAFKVANEDANIVSDEIFDVTGVVIMVCRHDVPLFVCDITTPGERQEYGLALIRALLQELPDQATIGVLYDIGCQLDRSCQTYGYLDSDRCRITFACSVLHAYGHEWACQVVYNPRRRSGFGLSDGEGSERVWSRTRRLIPLLRRATIARRQFILERKFESCGSTMRAKMGNWISRKYKLIQRHRASSVADIRASGLSERQLRDQLELQRAEPVAETTTTSHELQTKLRQFRRMQVELDKVGSAMQDAVRIMCEEFGLPRSTPSLAYLEERRKEIKQYGEALFAEMRLNGAFPYLVGVPMQFLHNLLLAREEKRNIRSRVVEHLWELSRLHRARGGGHDPLGTKVRDAILKGWAPRWRSTKAAVSRYNAYVEQLENMAVPHLGLPLPTKLDLADLRNPTEDHPLWQDVWWPSSKPPPLWVTSERVRRGITALLVLDRCEEEEERLMLEGDNLARWWIYEMRGLVEAHAVAENPSDQLALEQMIREHRWLTHRWRCSILPAKRWESLLRQLPGYPGRSRQPNGDGDDIDLHWDEPLTPENWRTSYEDNRSDSTYSDAYDRAMADLDLVVEELGAVVVGGHELDPESEEDEVDSADECVDDPR